MCQRRIAGGDRIDRRLGRVALAHVVVLLKRLLHTLLVLVGKIGLLLVDALLVLVGHIGERNARDRIRKPAAHIAIADHLALLWRKRLLREGIDERLPARKLLLLHLGVRRDTEPGCR